MAWDEILNGAVIDTVWFIKECTAEEVRKALIGHDGFDARIEVKEATQ